MEAEIVLFFFRFASRWDATSRCCVILDIDQIGPFGFGQCSHPNGFQVNPAVLHREPTRFSNDAILCDWARRWTNGTHFKAIDWLKIGILDYDWTLWR
jgi:hypothetical protein